MNFFLSCTCLLCFADCDYVTDASVPDTTSLTDGTSQTDAFAPASVSDVSVPATNDTCVTEPSVPDQTQPQPLSVSQLVIIDCCDSTLVAVWI